MAARCNCLRRCTSSIAPICSANGSDAATASLTLFDANSSFGAHDAATKETEKQ